MVMRVKSNQLFEHWDGRIEVFASRTQQENFGGRMTLSLKYKNRRRLVTGWGESEYDGIFKRYYFIPNNPAKLRLLLG